MSERQPELSLQIVQKMINVVLQHIDEVRQDEDYSIIIGTIIGSLTMSLLYGWSKDVTLSPGERNKAFNLMLDGIHESVKKSHLAYKHNEELH